VADQPSRAYGRNASQIPSGLFGVLTVLTAGLVVAFLYFARDVVVPIALAVLLSFLLAPAVRWLRRLQLGRVAAVTLTVLIAFLAMLGFAAVVVQEISSLAQQLPAYRSNLEAKIRSLPGAVPGGGVLRRATSMLPGTRPVTEAIRNPDFQIGRRPLCPRHFPGRAGEACAG
jgi:predicted PurR-regulated permease PerM